MTRSWMRAVALCVLAGAAALTVGAPRARHSAVAATPDQAVSWVNTGDSYSSGEGVDGNTGACAQSDKAYGPLAAERLRAKGWKIEPDAFTACTGHLVEDEFNARTGSSKKSLWEWGTDEQGVPNRVDVVTLSFGGNDIGFADLISACAEQSGATFVGAVGAGATGAILGNLSVGTACDTPEAVLRGRIDALLDPGSCTDRRQTATSDAAFDCRLLLEGGRSGSIVDFYVDMVTDHLTPTGTLVVVGYPSLFAPTGEWRWYEKAMCSGVGRGDAQKLTRVAAYFDERLHAAVDRANQRLGAKRVRYVSRYDLFRNGGHELCGGGVDWINGLSRRGHAGSSFHVETSFHPNAPGHDATADEVVTKLVTPECDVTLLGVAAAVADGDDPVGRPTAVSDERCVGDWAVATSDNGASSLRRLFRWSGWTWVQQAELPDSLSVCDVVDAGAPQATAEELLAAASAGGCDGDDASDTTVTTVTVGPEGPWPTHDNEGTPAFWAYLGASFYMPDWASCSDAYCLAGDSSTVHVYKMDGLVELGTVPTSTADPAAALQSLGLSTAEAHAVLTPGTP